MVGKGRQRRIGLLLALSTGAFVIFHHGSHRMVSMSPEIHPASRAAGEGLSLSRTPMPDPLRPPLSPSITPAREGTGEGGARPEEEREHPVSSRIHPPSMRVLQSEARMDPHAPPPALVQFADELAQRLQGALDAPELAIRLFSELSQCVLAKEGRADSPPVQIQALCLATARILARDEPGIFEARLRVLESRSNSQALRLQDAFEALQR